jgi:hypothetical protein
MTRLVARLRFSILLSGGRLPGFVVAIVVTTLPSMPSFVGPYRHRSLVVVVVVALLLLVR